jgi:hypothetical protein
MNSTATKTSNIPSNSALPSTGVKKPAWKKPSRRLPSKKLIENQLSKSSTEDEDLDRLSARAKKQSAGMKKPPASRVSTKLTAELVKTSSDEDSDVVYKPSAGPMSKKSAKKLLESSTEEEEKAKVNEADQPSTSSGRSIQLSTKEIPPTFSAKGIEKENRNRIISDESDDDVHDPPSQVSNAVKRKVPVNEEPKSVPTKKVRQDDDESEVEAQAENDESNTTTDSSESSFDDANEVVPLYTLDDDDCLVCDECQRKFDNAKLLELHLVNDHAPLF